MHEQQNSGLRRRTALAALGASCLVGAPARAQAYPSKPVKIVMTTGVGGISDVAIRLMAEELGKRLGQQVVVENRPGANGLVGTLAVKNSPPDGYTFVCGEMPKVSSIFVRNSVDAGKDLLPVSRIFVGDLFVYARTNGPIASLKDLAAFAKANRGTARLVSQSANVHMMMAVLANRGGYQLEYIPYKTTGETILALLNGDGDVTCNGTAGFLPQVEGGKLRMIGVLSAERSRAFPAVPTATEQGFPVVFNFEQALWAPLNTPRPVINQVSSAMAAVLKEPAMVEKYFKMGINAAPSTPQETAEKYKADIILNAEAARLIQFQPE